VKATRRSFWVSCVVAALAINGAPIAAADDCTPQQWIDLCNDGRSAYVPCVCNYMEDATWVIDGPDIDRPNRPPNRPDNSLPGGGSGRPGGGGGGGPIIGGGGGRGGGGRR